MARPKPYNFRPVIPGRVFRTNNPDSAPRSEQVRWARELGIRRVIDLRSETDIRSRGNCLASLFPLRSVNDSAKPSARLGRFAVYLDRPSFYLRVFEVSGLFHKLVMLLLCLWALLTGNKSPMMSYGAKHLAEPECLTLAYVYTKMIDNLQSGMRQVFRLILDNDGAPFLVSCDAGKDRTGIVSALIMDLAGKSRAEIVRNYHDTEKFAAPIQANIDYFFRGHNLPVEFAKAPAHTMEAVLDHLQLKYGNAKGYLVHLGFSDSEIEAIRRNITAA